MKSPYPDNYIKLVAIVDIFVNARTSDSEAEYFNLMRAKLDQCKADIARYAADSFEPPTTDEFSG